MLSENIKKLRKSKGRVFDSYPLILELQNIHIAFT